MTCAISSGNPRPTRRNADSSGRALREESDGVFRTMSVKRDRPEWYDEEQGRAGIDYEIGRGSSFPSALTPFVRSTRIAVNQMIAPMTRALGDFP